MIEAARLGQGIAYVPELSARTDIAAGTLVPLLADWRSPFPGDLRLIPRQPPCAAGAAGFH
ncbi:hypothetical protein D2T30_05330 [Sinirhodobacter populi]|uniref:LysR substrate-binding domain-containing protein n=2 Tax=Paenirhodobacter populi TaxID=2306993 RepID=A0A443JRC2_9RHOB|nr:hypothetical protein D2T30_05330 [Sinirhodobacter populi]